jgi:hypothetical protein
MCNYLGEESEDTNQDEEANPVPTCWDDERLLCYHHAKIPPH